MDFSFNGKDWNVKFININIMKIMAILSGWKMG